ncbi:MAG: immunoglobulin domain-containing protein, partial [Candidatus Acidiferrales bacterium]
MIDPTITTPPANQTVTAGQTATFTVVAAGTAPFSYQWQKNGTAISGATSSAYSTPATTSSDSGALFTVVVTNSVGSTTSSAATLNVISVTVIDGINIPASHPRMFWNATKMAQAKQWWTGHSYTPNYTNPNPFDPYDTLFACEMTNNPTWCNAQIDWAVNLSATSCYQSSGCDLMRVYGEAVMLTYDWLYAQMTAAQRTTIINHWNTWQNYPDTNDSWGNTGMPSSVDFAGGLRTDFSLGVATFGDNAAATSFIDYALNNRWAAVVNFVSPSGVAPLGAKGYGMPAQEGSQNGPYFLNYHAVPLATSAILGRDLWQESTAFKAGVLQTIYSTLPTPTVLRGLYDGWTWSDDQNWSSGAGLYGGGGMQSRYYGDFMMAAAQEFPTTAIGKLARQWTNTVNPSITPMWTAIDPGGSAQALSTLPLDYYASGPQFAYWRNNWNTNASSLFLQMGQSFGVGHTHFDVGNFQWFRGGSYLIRETPSYYTTVAGYNSVGTADVSLGYAHNVPLIGGLPGAADSCTDSNAIVRRMESQSAYAYIDADISGTYTNNICDPGRPERENPYAQHVEREFIFLRDIEVLLILDRLQADSASRSRTFLSHCETNPVSIDAAHYACVDGTQQASYSVLLPATPTLVAVNEAANGATCASSECQYRLEVNDNSPIGTQSYFLVAIQGLNAGGTPLSPTLQDNGTSWTVVLDPNHSVTLNKGMVSAGGSVTISGATTNLRGDAQTMAITDNGPVWGPSITTTPEAPMFATPLANQTVTAGQTATFTVVAAGTAPLGYQWQKSAVNISGATSVSYTTPATATTDSGSTFTVVVSNTAGTVTSAAATLTVNPAPIAPTITTTPANQTVTAGQIATFTVVAAGTAPLSYQWQKNGVSISGGTSASYTTPATATTDSGSTFTVVVSNTAGTVTSAAATLTVNPAPIAPTITTTPANQTVT